MGVFERYLSIWVGLGIIAGVFGALLGFASIRFKVDADPIVDQLDALLPQTQCGQCGYPGCKPYAQAVAEGEAINKCAPGGEDTIKKIADLMGVEVQPLDDSHQHSDTDNSNGKTKVTQHHRPVAALNLSNTRPETMAVRRTFMQLKAVHKDDPECHYPACKRSTAEVFSQYANHQPAQTK